MGVKNDKRIVVFIGHFGSGKTECAVNYAMKVKQEMPASKVAIADLDIANPYTGRMVKQSLPDKEEMKNPIRRIGLQMKQSAF